MKKRYCKSAVRLGIPTPKFNSFKDWYEWLAGDPEYVLELKHLDEALTINHHQI